MVMTSEYRERSRKKEWMKKTTAQTHAHARMKINLECDWVWNDEMVTVWEMSKRRARMKKIDRKRKQNENSYFVVIISFQISDWDD